MDKLKVLITILLSVILIAYIIILLLNEHSEIMTIKQWLELLFAEFLVQIVVELIFRKNK